MNNQNRSSKKRQSQTKTIFATLAAAVVVITALTAITNISLKETPKTTSNTTAAPAIDTSDEEAMAPITLQTTEITTEDTTPPHKDVAAQTEHTTEQVTEITTAPAAVIPELFSPVNGSVIVAHSGDVPVFSVTMNDYRPHIGVDISAPVGSDVYAVADGVISEITEDPMWGNCMTVEHEGGLTVTYKNISPLLPDKISAGSAVKAGQVIASVGETALLEISEESHLHFEMAVDGEVVDPAEYIVFEFSTTEYEG